MRQNIRIAKELLNIARSIVGFNEYEKARWWFAGDKAFQVVNSIRNENTILKNGEYQFYLEEKRDHAAVSCNLLARQAGQTVTLKAFNFWESHYDDQNYGDWVENTIPMADLGLTGIQPESFTRVSDEDTAAKVKAYVDMLKSKLANAADTLENIAVPPFNR